MIKKIILLILMLVFFIMYIGCKKALEPGIYTIMIYGNDQMVVGVQSSYQGKGILDDKMGYPPFVFDIDSDSYIIVVIEKIQIQSSTKIEIRNNNTRKAIFSKTYKPDQTEISINIGY